MKPESAAPDPVLGAILIELRRVADATRQGYGIDLVAAAQRIRALCPPATDPAEARGAPR